VGSGIIAYNNIKELAEHHSIYLICLDTVKDLGDFAASLEHAEFVEPEKRSRLIQLFRHVFYILLGIPAFIVKGKSPLMKMHVEQLTETNNFDAILLYEIAAIQYCPPSSYKKIIANIEDPLSIKHNRMRILPVWSLWQRVKLFVNERSALRFENRYFPLLGKVLLLSESDRLDLKEQGGYDNLGCVSYGVARQSIKDIINREGRTEGMIVYSGSMFHPPNVDGALFFLQKIFPLVLQAYSTAKLWIVGAEPDKRICSAAQESMEHIVITGRVEDISEYLRTAKVSICPVRLKIGVQTKILEALSWGTPVVTTSAGNSGINGSSGKELWVEDDPRQFAGRVVSLLQGEDWDRFSEDGRKFVEERFSWRRSAAELEKHVASIHAKELCLEG
jgi:polysaccharide biosynthesis protein PslH